MKTNDATLFRVFRKSERLARLDGADRAALRGLPMRLESVPSDHLLVKAGDMATECAFLLKGYACRHKTTAGGKRQIVSFHLPGDIPGVQHLLLRRADHAVETITDASLAWVPVADLKHLALGHPTLGEALWRDSLIEACIFREWVLNLARRDPAARIAHMLCEFAARCEAAGTGSKVHAKIPMSHKNIADATGQTSVHVSRMMHGLVKEGVIVCTKNEVEIADWARLRHIADFDPAYLHEAA